LEGELGNGKPWRSDRPGRPAPGELLDCPNPFIFRHVGLASCEWPSVLTTINLCVIELKNNQPKSIQPFENAASVQPGGRQGACRQLHLQLVE
jgi:hypothetical protein